MDAIDTITLQFLGRQHITQSKADYLLYLEIFYPLCYKDIQRVRKYLKNTFRVHCTFSLYCDNVVLLSVSMTCVARTSCCILL